MTSYLAENLQAMKEEACQCHNIDNYTSSISHELSTRFPKSSIELYSTDWPSVTKKFMRMMILEQSLTKPGILMMI
jgi:hypothetical protein